MGAGREEPFASGAAITLFQWKCLISLCFLETRFTLVIDWLSTVGRSLFLGSGAEGSQLFSTRFGKPSQMPHSSSLHPRRDIPA